MLDAVEFSTLRMQDIGVEGNVEVKLECVSLLSHLSCFITANTLFLQSSFHTIGCTLR